MSLLENVLISLATLPAITNKNLMQIRSLDQQINGVIFHKKAK